MWVTTLPLRAQSVMLWVAALCRQKPQLTEKYDAYNDCTIFVAVILDLHKFLAEQIKHHPYSPARIQFPMRY